MRGTLVKHTHLGATSVRVWGVSRVEIVWGLKSTVKLPAPDTWYVNTWVTCSEVSVATVLAIASKPCR